jgi:predicted GNAT superfamily acetyltransferase
VAQPEVRLVDDPHDIPAVVALFSRVWPDPDGAAYASDLLSAVVYAGGYLAGAFDADHLVGGSLGFLGRHGDALVLHSHVTGVLPGLEHAGIGSQLKHHQRGWAHDHDLSAVIWTFDPLVRRNAWFNLGKLGARVVDYVECFYGTLTDSINAGDETDRAIAWWPTGALAGSEARRGCTVVDPWGVVHPRPDDAEVVHVHTPTDIVGMRATDPDDARRWRYALRAGFGDAIRAGFVATSCSRDGEYTLERQC